MPFIHIKSVRQGFNPGPMLVELCEGLAKVDGVRPEDVNATYETLSPNHYAQGLKLALQQPETTHPPLVDLLAWQGRDPAVIRRLLETAAAIIARHMELPINNVFIHYQEAYSGKVFADGQVI